MDWVAARVIFDPRTTVMAAELIASVFYDLGVKGVVIDDPEADPAEGWGEDAVPPCTDHAVTAYFPRNADLEAHCRALEAGLKRLATVAGLHSRVVYSDLCEEDWAESWKAFFWPQKVTPGIVVKPTWRTYDPHPGETVIEIDPGMAFGTGTHPTTVLCLRLLETLITPGAAFLDVGTGSGILMIAAAKLGAGTVRGVDNDPVAVAVAEKNLQLNNLAPPAYRVSRGDLVNGILGRYDLVAANILLPVILVLLERVAGVLAKNGALICSGLLAQNRDEVLARMQAKGLTVETVLTDQAWMAVAARRRS
ncbi:MAG: 50S ribosomal protein L11 methyltransferase [Desulfobacterales bacterium]|jgi:ribosomal protein L11 methyltransferase